MKTCLSIFFSAILASGGAALSQEVNLKGRVVEKATLQPVPGASVKLTGSSLSSLTGADGRFTLKGIPSAAARSRGAVASPPYLQDGDLHVDALAAGQPVQVELFTVTGESVNTVRSTAPKPGWNRMALSPFPDRDFLGFARITTAGVTHVKRLLYMTGPGRSRWSRELGPARRTLAKGAAGQVEVAKELLQGKTVAFSANDEDLGDIVLEYPARVKTGVGAAQPYGAMVLFDGSKGMAAAAAELKEKWQDWIPAVTGTELSKYTAARDQFKIAKDPQYPGDTGRVTLQSCCNQTWGYDDIQAKTVHSDAQIHVEFLLMGQYDNVENSNVKDPIDENPRKPGYNNSGVYVQSRYEIQIKSWNTVPDSIPDDHGMGSVVNNHAPTQNANKANGIWQAYDITFRSARYNTGGTLTDSAYISVWWNGILVHDNRKANGKATGLANHSGEPLNPTLYGLKLQSEGTDVRYRNIWMKPLDIKDPQTSFGY